MEVEMDQEYQQEDEYGSVIAFFTGVVAGVIVGAGLGMLFAPRRGEELRRQVADSATKVSQNVSQTVDDLAGKGQAAYDRVRDVASRAGQAVDRITEDARKAVDAVTNSETAKTAVATPVRCTPTPAPKSTKPPERL